MDFGNLSVAALLRQLNHEYEEDDVTKKKSTSGFGLSFGGKIKIGQKDDLRCRRWRHRLRGGGATKATRSVGMMIVSIKELVLGH